MCGRYYIDENDPLLRGFVDAARRKGEVKSGEIFPGDTAAVVANNRKLEPGVFPMRWGMERPGGGLVINARSETAANKPMFRESARLRRCLVPASWYFEWERRPEGKTKYALRPERGGIVYLGGLYMLDRDGTPRFTILTRDAAPGIAFIHDRMPVLVPPEKRYDWLSQQLTLDELLSYAETDVEYKEPNNNE